MKMTNFMSSSFSAPNQINNPFGESGPTPGQVLERIVYSPSSSSAGIFDGQYIQQVVPSISCSQDEYVHIWGGIKYIKTNSASTRVVQSQVRVRRNGGSAAQVVGPITNVIPNVNSYCDNVLAFWDFGSAGNTNVYTIDLDHTAGGSSVAMIGGGEGTQVVFDRVYMPASLVTTITSGWSWGSDPA